MSPPRLLLGTVASATAAILLGAGIAPPASPALESDEVAVASVGNPADLAFSVPVLIDHERAGGEPVIAVTSSGVILVSAHPQYHHVRPSLDSPHVPTEWLGHAMGQSYLWRSADGGATWTHIGLPFVSEGPRSVGFGQGDPDFAIMDSGRILHTDLFALSTAAVSWSDDGGATWILGNTFSLPGGGMDRQWITAHGEWMYLTAHALTGTSPAGIGKPYPVLRSKDGVVWEGLGSQRCAENLIHGDIVAAPDGTLYVGCGAGISTSTDGGFSWTARPVPGHDHGETFAMAEPAVDGAGNVWIAWQEGYRRVFVAGSADRGENWQYVHELTTEVRQAIGAAGGMAVYPWVSAGSKGRIAVSVYATPYDQSDPGIADPGAIWSVVTVALFDADSQTPSKAGFLLKADSHRGPICTFGLVDCAFETAFGGGDRRLAEYFETTIDNGGFLHATYADTTTHPDHWMSHPAYVRQTGGPRFVVDGFSPTQG